MFTFSKSIWKLKIPQKICGRIDVGRHVCGCVFKEKPPDLLLYGGHINVLGIESTCDDTAAAVLNDSGTILGEAHFSQARVHLEMGGIIPNLAHEFHQKYLKNVVDAAMKQSQLGYKELDAIAVAVKPGLILSLTAGLEHAKDLCTLYQKPLIPIHHMQAHALTARILEDIKFPFLVFLMSGGHCILALAKSVDKFDILGEATDATPGQSMDKLARRAKLKNIKKLRGLVGGAAIERAALKGNAKNIHFSQTINKFKDCNFSFGGIQSSAVKYIENQEKVLKLEPDAVIPNINDLCASFQWSLTRHMCQRLEVAINYLNVKNILNEKCLVVSGGVASNSFIRKALKFVCDEYDYRMVVPPAKLCTDNGIMISWNGIEILRENLPVVAPSNLSSVTPMAKCPMGEKISEDVRRVIKENNFRYVRLNKFLEIEMEQQRQQDEECKKSGCST